ncbi:hypothetical protein HMI54_009687 [Coelomomyces lativittatus]|nr:hypothetical protein HMI54_009687 [Coelomomyces lativittatus]
MKEKNWESGQWYDIYFPSDNEDGLENQEKQEVLDFSGIYNLNLKFIYETDFNILVPFGTLRFMKTVLGLSAYYSQISKEISERYGPNPLPKNDFIQSYREYLESQGLKINTMFYRDASSITESEDEIKNELSKFSIPLVKNIQDTKTFDTQATNGGKVPVKDYRQIEYSQYLRQVLYFSYGWQNIQVKAVSNRNFYSRLYNGQESVEFLEIKGTFQQLITKDFLAVRIPLKVEGEKSSTFGGKPLSVSAYFFDVIGDRRLITRNMFQEVLKASPLEGTMLIPKIKLKIWSQFVVSTYGSTFKPENIGLTSFGTIKTALVGEGFSLCLNEKGVKVISVNELRISSNESPSSFIELQGNLFDKNVDPKTTLEFNQPFFLYIYDDHNLNPLSISYITTGNVVGNTDPC